MDPLIQADFGQSLASVDVERGLLELCHDLVFDLGGTHDLWHPSIETRQGVYYRDQHICSMDRGVIPEYKIWESKKVVADCPWYEADKEDASIAFVEVARDDPEYAYQYRRTLMAGDDNPEFFIRPSDGKLMRCVARRYKTVRGRCLRVGWRHTFEGILRFGVPGVTREALARKFNVDMYKVPVGPIEELVAALVEE